jgi:hypothetical protein
MSALLDVNGNPIPVNQEILPIEFQYNLTFKINEGVQVNDAEVIHKLGEVHLLERHLQNIKLALGNLYDELIAKAQEQSNDNNIS